MGLINADILKKEISEMAIKNNYPADKANALCKIIDSQPTVDAEPVRHGKWIEVHSIGETTYECSECREEFATIGGMPAEILYNYCSNCGAKMEG